MIVLFKCLSNDIKEIIFVLDFFCLLNVEFYLVFYKEKILNYCIDMKVCNDRVKILKLIGELFMVI